EQITNLACGRSIRTRANVEDFAECLPSVGCLGCLRAEQREQRNAALARFAFGLACLGLDDIEWQHTPVKPLLPRGRICNPGDLERMLVLPELERRLILWAMEQNEPAERLH